MNVLASSNVWALANQQALLAWSMLEEQLGDKAWLVVRYLGWPGPKRNTMTICNTAQASIRFCLAKPS